MIAFTLVVKATYMGGYGVKLELGSPLTDYLSGGKLPFSFVYGGESSENMISRFMMSEKASSDNGVSQIERLYEDEMTGLQCKLVCKSYSGGISEWVVTFRNRSEQNLPILEHVKAIDLQYELPQSKDAILHYSKGSSNQYDDFMPQRIQMKDRELHRFTPVGGRSSNGVLPFFNLQQEELGLIIAVGWSGQWSAELTCPTQNRFAVRAGQANLRLSLLPGEEIRTPSIVLVPWTGSNRMDGQNKLRRFIIEHKTPKVEGETITGPITVGSWGGTETAVHLNRIRAVKELELPYNYYWVDAGWYGDSNADTSDEFTGEWYRQAGDWNYHRKYYPDGVRVVSDAARESGLKFLLWMEPERAIYGKPITLEHPEWYVGNKVEGESLLLNLGQPEALEWLIGMISGIIAEHGIDLFRQDFNFNPLPYWESIDTPDRIGAAEAHYVQGLYTFWDELLRRHPGLIIDNCASGGRRIDIETTSRSIPLWRSDVQCVPSDPIAAQTHGFGLSYWIPLSGTAARSSAPYDARSILSAAAGLSPYFQTDGTVVPDFPVDELRDRLQEYSRARAFFAGDFYPLTDCSISPQVWLAYQMDRPDLGQGIVAAFRRQESPFVTAIFQLQGIDTEENYELEDADTKEIQVIRGSALQSLQVEIGQCRQSKLYFYRKQ
ncbi:alpha-galactosidase [Paenibacillus sp. OV219]|nr:alpha-galactosidase [Paenibacillus sp. OV219]